MYVYVCASYESALVHTTTEHADLTQAMDCVCCLGAYRNNTKVKATESEAINELRNKLHITKPGVLLVIMWLLFGNMLLRM